MDIHTKTAQRKRPEIKVSGGKWMADLRANGFGRYQLGPSALDREEAMHLAYELLAKLRGERMAEIAQRDLFVDAGPELFATLLDRWLDGKRADTDGGRDYVRKYAALVRRELGDYKVADFTPPDGNARLVAYVQQLENRGLTGRTIRNRLSTARQALTLAVTQGWLPSVPLPPAMPPKPAPVFDWYTEAMFRALRAETFKGSSAAQFGLQKGHEFEVHKARRRVYLSWLMYTGVHTADADAANADHLFLDARAYIRHNTKSSRVVGAEQFEMPEPLHADLSDLQTLLGRPFLPGEAFAGGPWPHVARIMASAARRLGLPRVNPRILRRSYAREMFIHGYEVTDVADRMGHVDDRMLREIYVKTPRPQGHQRSRWTLPPASPATPRSASGLARVLQIKRT